MDINTTIEFILFLCGAYLMFVMIRMKSTNELPRVLVSRSIEIKYVRDKEGFINYVYVRGIISAMIISLFAIVELICEVYGLNDILLLISRLFYCIGIIYFSKTCIKAQKKFLIKEY